MTLSSTTSKVQYSGDDSTVSFSTGFVFQLNSHVVVILTDSSGVETTWVEGTQYTLTGAGTGANGTITVDTSPTDYTPATGETLTVKRVPPLTQLTDLPIGGALPSSDLEDMDDLNVMQMQSLQEQVDRAITLAATSAESAITIADLTGNAGKTLVVNATEDGFGVATVTSGGSLTIPLPIVDGGTGAITAGAARSALTADPDDLSQDDDMILAIQTFGG